MTPFESSGDLSVWIRPCSSVAASALKCLKCYKFVANCCWCKNKTSCVPTPEKIVFCVNHFSLCFLSCKLKVKKQKYLEGAYLYLFCWQCYLPSSFSFRLPGWLCSPKSMDMWCWQVLPVCSWLDIWLSKLAKLARSTTCRWAQVFCCQGWM